MSIVNFFVDHIGIYWSLIVAALLVAIIIWVIFKIVKNSNKKRDEEEAKANPLTILGTEDIQIFYIRKYDKKLGLLSLGIKPDNMHFSGKDDEDHWFVQGDIPDNLCVEDTFLQVDSKEETPKEEVEESSSGDEKKKKEPVWIVSSYSKHARL